jgi:hypothetical protein
MADRQNLTPERLAQLLAQLNDVMSEAQRLRREITRQLGEQRHTIQQKVTPARKRARKVR